MNNEQIIQGLECCIEFLCGECPYKQYEDATYEIKCMHKLMLDISHLMKISEDEECEEY